MAVTSRVTLPSPLLRCDMIFSTHREATSPWRSGRKEQRNSPGPADFELATDEQRRMARHHGAKPQPARRCEAVEGAGEAGSGETREEFYRLLQLEGAYRAGLAGLKQFLRTIGGPDE